MIRIEIALLRIVCTAVVVFFHSVGRYSHPELQAILSEDVRTVTSSLVFIAVAMFFFISGFLYNSQLKKGRYQSFVALVKNKTVHLIFPYFSCAVLTMWICLFWDMQLVLSGRFWHLWFLPALFWCFIIFYGVYALKLGESFTWIILPLLYGLSFLPEIEVASFGVLSFLKWGVIFGAGWCYATYEKGVRNFLSRYNVWVIVLLLWIANDVFLYTPYATFTWTNTLAIIGACSVLVYGCGKIRYSEKWISIIIKLSSLSMGVYLLHYAVLAYMSSSTAYRLMGCMDQSSELYALVAVLFITVVTIIVSAATTRVFQINRYTKYLLG